MSNTKLSSITRQSALLTPEKDNFWPISDQYIGLEMELERYSNKELDNHRMAGSPFWVEHQDGSLRNGVEMVLSQALMGTSLREAISYFFRTFTKYSATPRTSIHVHVNMRQDNETVEGLRNMVALYYMYEDAFFHIADQNRKWCAYCNAFEDTPPAILEAVMSTDMGSEELAGALTRSAGQNTNRYYGLNLNALFKFGTLEFRHFPLVTDESRLIDWLKLIMELKAAANRMADEGNTPWSVFVTPDDMDKLTDYMPLYGHLLASYVAPSRSFHRMIIVRNLGMQRQDDIRQEVRDNPAFRIFQEYQTKLGKKVSVKPEKVLKTGLNQRQRDIEALTREIAAFNALEASGRTLTVAQNRRRTDYTNRLIQIQADMRDEARADMRGEVFVRAPAAEPTREEFIADIETVERRVWQTIGQRVGGGAVTTEDLRQARQLFANPPPPTAPRPRVPRLEVTAEPRFNGNQNTAFNGFTANPFDETEFNERQEREEGL